MMSSKESINSWFSKLLACPVCKSDIELSGEVLTCVNKSCGSQFPVIDGIPIMLQSKLVDDLKLTEKKWTQEYQKFHLLEKVDPQHDLGLRDSYNHLQKYFKFINNGYFLEVGSGCSKLSFLLAQKGIKTVGVDLSLSALRIGKALFERANLNGLFVCGDICALPFKNNIFSLMYGGGVIEHFKDTKKAVDELFRCLTIHGLITTTVPYVSGSTAYRIVLWGNIPDIPVLREILEFVEIDTLKGKRLRFGYEKSFTSPQIRNIFGKAGFKKVEVGLFETYYPLEIIPNDSFKVVISRFVNSSRFFWPMIYVNGEK